MGIALGTWSLPFIEAAFGVHGVRLALIWDMGNIIAGALSFQYSVGHACMETLPAVQSVVCAGHTL